MTGTPARDALVAYMVGRFEDTEDWFSHSNGEFAADFAVDRPDLVLAALIESGWRPDDDQLRAVILAAGEQTCPLCMGEGCEWGCRRCRYANVGPASHRVCRRCQGRGTVKEMTDGE